MKFKAVFFDCDGVLTHDGWKKLDDFAIPQTIWMKMIARHERGELTIEDWIKESISLYSQKRITNKVLQKLYADLKINTDASGLFKFLHKSGIKTAIISAGFETYVRIVAEKLGVEDYYCNSILIFDIKGHLKDIKKRSFDQEQYKVNCIDEFCIKENIDPQETIFVGDSLNDRGAFKHTKHGILLNPTMITLNFRNMRGGKLKPSMRSKRLLLDKVADDIAHCKICRVGKIGKAVPGEGGPDAKIVFIGEAPGKKEAETGRPFVGRSGQLLRSFIKNAGLTEQEVYITSPVKYLPIYKTPRPADIEHGKTHLLKQLSTIDPRIIVLLGSVAQKALLEKTYPVLKEHGRLITQNGRKYLITIHPAAAVRFPIYKKILLADFTKIKKLME